MQGQEGMYMGQWGSTPCFSPSINLKFSFSASPLAYIFRYRGSNAPAPLSSAQVLIGVGVRDAWKLERAKDSSFYPADTSMMRFSEKEHNATKETFECFLTSMKAMMTI